ncbi:uncharacterized protein LOC143062594 [Mytilus galloprovincialis]|uniref:uncharacterized protein LOC143062594 n=1 Tax=Mytilus galloprovincialis TaxID=29158 RepID=UPI003F7BBFEA
MVEGNQQEKEGLDNNRQPQEPKRTPDTSENIRRKKVKWPNNKSKSEWQQFDEDVDAILNTTLAGNIDRKIESMTSFIYNIGMDRFGADEKEVVRREGQKNRRESKIAKMRKDLRQLKKRYNQASEDEKPALSELRDTIRKKLKITRRAERTRKRRKKREKARAQFTSDPFQFTSRLLGKKGSGQLKASKEEVEEYLREMHSDPKREDELPDIEQLIRPENPEQVFDESPPKLKEVVDVIKKGRAASAPGPNGVPYKLRFTVGDFTTSWQRLEVGIVTGCTISVILFSAAMNMIVKSVEKKSRGPWMKSGVRQPPGRAFMDDMTISTKTVIEARWTLQELDKMITWARMKVKPSKSRSLVVKNGKVKEERFKIGDEIIPTVSEKPVKCLGKWFNNTLSDKLNVEDTYKQLDDWLKAVDKSGLPGNRDEKVRSAKVEIRTGRKWSTKKTIEDAESRLKHSEIVGRVAVGRQGLDVTPTAKWRTATVEEKRHLVQKEVRSMEEESRMEGEKGQKKKVEGSGLLVTATDWQMLVDLKQKLQFPPQIAVTNQRPDIVIWSASTKQAILLELTVPWEERIEDAYERKRLKYQDLLAECRDNGWRVWLFPVEVGSRGFVGQSMWRALRALGIVGGERSKLIGNLCKEAETASMWLWRKRSEQWKQ